MAVPQELDQKYLLNLNKKLRSAKKKFYRGFTFYGQGKIPYHPFLEQYAIPLINIEQKIEAFKQYFIELNVNCLILPIIEESVDRAVLCWYEPETITEDLIYNEEKIAVEFDQFY